MKLLEQYQSGSEAESLAEQLESKGIPCFVSSKLGARYGYGTGTFKVGLWILLPEQLKEAKSVLSDPNYQVRNPVSEADIARLKGELSTSAFETIIGPMLGLLAILVLALIIYIRRVSS